MLGKRRFDRHFVKICTLTPFSMTPFSTGILCHMTGPAHEVINGYEINRNILAAKENEEKTGTDDWSKYTYGVNSLGQRFAMDLDLDSDVDGSGVVSSDVDWNYNDRGELIEADHEIAAHERAYKFDAIGNRKETVSGTTTLTGTDDYAANSVNEYTEVEGSTTGLAYDDNGNLTGDGTLEYFWDAENRLVRVTDGTNTFAEYTYDYQGRRIAKASTASAPQGVGNRIYFYQGWNLIAEYTADSDWNNEVLDFNYTWGLDLSQSLQGAGGVGGLLVAEKVSTGNTGEYYPTYDGNGNVSEFINSSGAQVAHYEYDAFGNQLSLSSGSLKNIFAHRFSTKYHDEETGFYYYGYRYYDPVTGRWPSRDPIEEEGGVNLYGMVGNRTVDRVDYFGLKPVHKPSPAPPVGPVNPGLRPNPGDMDIHDWDMDGRHAWYVCKRNWGQGTNVVHRSATCGAHPFCGKRCRFVAQAQYDCRRQIGKPKSGDVPDLFLFTYKISRCVESCAGLTYDTDKLFPQPIELKIGFETLGDTVEMIIIGGNPDLGYAPGEDRPPSAMPDPEIGDFDGKPPIWDDSEDPGDFGGF